MLENVIKVKIAFEALNIIQVNSWNQLEQYIANQLT